MNRILFVVLTMKSCIKKKREKSKTFFWIEKQYTKPWQVKPIIAALPEIISEASEGNIFSNNWTCLPVQRV